MQMICTAILCLDRIIIFHNCRVGLGLLLIEATLAREALANAETKKERKRCRDSLAQDLFKMVF